MPGHFATGTADDPRILLIDDDPDARALATLVLRQEFPDSRIAPIAGALEFTDALLDGNADALVLDPRLSWADGLALAEHLKRRQPACLVVALGPEDAPVPGQRDPAAEIDAWLGKNAHGFHRLGATLRRLRERAQRARDAAQGLAGGALGAWVNSVAQGVLAVHADGTIALTNPALARLLGRAGEDPLAGRDVATVFGALGALVPWQTLLASADPFHGDLGPHSEGQASLHLDLWPLHPGQPGAGHGGLLWPVAGAAGAQAPADLPPESTRAGEELDQLAYAVSHDLQEPLNIVSRHAQLLQERLGRQLEPEAARFLSNLLLGTERMQAMVDGVLEYSRAGSRGREFLPLAFDEALDEALGNLRLNLEEAGVEVLRTPLPTLPADRWSIVQLFQNLLANAIKFRSSASPRIVIGAREQADDWRFAVRDNGIGIDSRFQERIFALFQRLHTPEEYPGTGIGLTLCRRLVERHGGLIWVRSIPGEGATFYFTIPKTQPPSAEPHRDPG